MSDETAPLKILTGQEILAADDVYFEDIHVPRWGGVVRLRALSAEAAGEWSDQSFGVETKIGDDGKEKEVLKRKMSAVKSKALLIFLCAIKADGSPAFEDRADIDKLAARSAESFRVVADAAERINGFGDKSDAGKDSGGTPTDGPSSASPESSEKPSASSDGI